MNKGTSWINDLHEMGLLWILPQVFFIEFLGTAFSNSSLKEEQWQKYNLMQTTLCTLF